RAGRQALRRRAVDPQRPAAGGEQADGVEAEGEIARGPGLARIAAAGGDDAQVADARRQRRRLDVDRARGAADQTSHAHAHWSHSSWIFHDIIVLMAANRLDQDGQVVGRTYLGIDGGFSKTRAALIDGEGRLLAVAALPGSPIQAVPSEASLGVLAEA